MARTFKGNVAKLRKRLEQAQAVVDELTEYEAEDDFDNHWHCDADPVECSYQARLGEDEELMRQALAVLTNEIAAFSPRMEDLAVRLQRRLENRPE